MKLYHCQGARSLRCVWALEEMGLDYELVTLQFPPRVFDKSYKEVNPLGTVPCLIDGEVMMTESAGICEYLGVRYGPTPLALTPEEEDYGAYLNWLHRSDATLTFPQTLVLRYYYLEPIPEKQAVADDYSKWFIARLKRLDAHLENNDYLVDGRFTIADIAVGYALFLGTVLKLEEHYTPQTREYLERLKARPGFKRANGFGEPLKLA